MATTTRMWETEITIKETLFEKLQRLKDSRLSEFNSSIQPIDKDKHVPFMEKEKIFIIAQMPCGCPVGTHMPDHAHSAFPCPMSQHIGE